MKIACVIESHRARWRCGTAMELPASPSPYSAIESVSSSGGIFIAPLLSDPLLGARLLPTLQYQTHKMKILHFRLNATAVSSLNDLVQQRQLRDDNVRLRVLVEAALFKVLSSVHGLALVHRVLAAPVALHDTDED